jgi:hypothetical protein
MKPIPIRPSIPGSGTVVPPEVDEVVVVPPEVDEVVVPPEVDDVVVPPEVLDVVVPPEVLDVVEDVDEDDPHQGNPRANAGVVASKAIMTVATVAIRFMAFPLFV